MWVVQGGLANRVTAGITGEEFHGLLKSSQKYSDEFTGPPSFNIKCLSCHHVQVVNTHTEVQKCNSCSSNLVVPNLRRIKAMLVDTLTRLIIFSDYKGGVPYSNFIGKFVEITDYALRRDHLPTTAQGLELLGRFEGVLPLTYFQGKMQLNKQDRKLSLLRLQRAKDAEEDKKIHEMLHKHLATLEGLFVQLSSGEIRA